MTAVAVYAGIVLACRGALDLWLEGSLFENLRGTLQAVRDGDPGPRRFLAELLTCRLCLTYQAALWAALIAAVAAVGTGFAPWWAAALLLAPGWLAIAGGVRVLDGIARNANA